MRVQDCYLMVAIIMVAIGVLILISPVTSSNKHRNQQHLQEHQKVTPSCPFKPEFCERSKASQAFYNCPIPGDDGNLIKCDENDLLKCPRGRCYEGVCQCVRLTLDMVFPVCGNNSLSYINDYETMFHSCLIDKYIRIHHHIPRDLSNCGPYWQEHEGEHTCPKYWQILKGKH